MTTQAWFRWSLILPIALPLLSIPLVIAAGDDLPILYWLILPLIFGGVPYILFATWLAVTLGRVTPRGAVVLVGLSPIAFALVEALFVAAASAAFGSPNLGMLVPLLAGFAVVYGYGYVIVAMVVYAMLRACGTIADEPSAVRRGRPRPGPRHARASVSQEFQ